MGNAGMPIRLIISTLQELVFRKLWPVSYTHLRAHETVLDRAHETVLDLVCRLLLEKKKYTKN